MILKTLPIVKNGNSLAINITEICRALGIDVGDMISISINGVVRKEEKIEVKKDENTNPNP